MHLTDVEIKVRDATESQVHGDSMRPTWDSRLLGVGTLLTLYLLLYRRTRATVTCTSSCLTRRSTTAGGESESQRGNKLLDPATVKAVTLQTVYIYYYDGRR